MLASNIFTFHLCIPDEKAMIDGESIIVLKVILQIMDDVSTSDFPISFCSPFWLGTGLALSFH